MGGTQQHYPSAVSIQGNMTKTELKELLSVKIPTVTTKEPKSLKNVPHQMTPFEVWCCEIEENNSRERV